MNLCVGTDSLASTDSLSLLGELRLLRDSRAVAHRRAIAAHGHGEPGARLAAAAASSARSLPARLADLIAVPLSHSFADVHEEIVAFDRADSLDDDRWPDSCVTLPACSSCCLAVAPLDDARRGDEESEAQAARDAADAGKPEDQRQADPQARSEARCTCCAEGEMPLSARGAIVLDAYTGQPLYEKSADLPSYPASTTKIMTALLVIEAGDLDREVEITEEDSKVGESSLEHQTRRRYTRAGRCSSA